MTDRPTDVRPPVCLNDWHRDGDETRPPWCPECRSGLYWPRKLQHDGPPWPTGGHQMIRKTECDDRPTGVRHECCVPGCGHAYWDANGTPPDPTDDPTDICDACGGSGIGPTGDTSSYCFDCNGNGMTDRPTDDDLPARLEQHARWWRSDEDELGLAGWVEDSERAAARIRELTTLGDALADAADALDIRPADAAPVDAAIAAWRNHQ